VAVVAVVTAFAAWLLWAMLFHANPPVSSEEIGHQVVDDHTATIKVNIKYGDGPVEATCVARAISHDKAVVGEQSFSPGRRNGTYEVTVRTDRRATTVEWIGCKAADQPRYQ
jgi:hypothetical protein